MGNRDWSDQELLQMDYALSEEMFCRLILIVEYTLYKIIDGFGSVEDVLTDVEHGVGINERMLR